LCSVIFELKACTGEKRYGRPDEQDRQCGLLRRPHRPNSDRVWYGCVYSSTCCLCFLWTSFTWCLLPTIAHCSACPGFSRCALCSLYQGSDVTTGRRDGTIVSLRPSKLYSQLELKLVIKMYYNKKTQEAVNRLKFIR